MKESYLTRVADESAILQATHNQSRAALGNLVQRQVDIGSKKMDLSLQQIGAGKIMNSIITRRLNKLDAQDSALSSAIPLASEERMNSFRSVTEHYSTHEGAYIKAALLEATRAGITIETQDPDALAKAQWQHEHISADGHPFSPVESFNISKLTGKDLEENLHLYPEMAWNLTDDEINSAKETFLSLPLLHTTSSEPLISALKDDTSQESILSHKKLSEAGIITGSYYDGSVTGHSFDVDQTLGLDEYIFICGAKPYAPDMHGKKAAVAVIDSSILLDDACIVTPNDVVNHSLTGFNGGIESDNDIAAVHAYRDSAVSGRGWVEIMARRIAMHGREHPGEAFPIETIFTCGEIKYRDQVPRAAIIGLLETNEDVKEYLGNLTSAVKLPQ